MSENVIDVTIEGGTVKTENKGFTAPIVATVDDGVCAVFAAPADGPFATLNVINKETGEKKPVNVLTCAGAVVCSSGNTMEEHLSNLYGHIGSPDAHLSEGQKQKLETKEGAQAKATAAKTEAIAAASLAIETLREIMAEDATTKAAGARDAAYRYADGILGKFTSHIGNEINPHNVTAEQIGLGNVPNKATNDLQPTYQVAETLSALTSGERLAVAFGKISKAIEDLITHISNESNPHAVTASQTGALPKTGGAMTGNLAMDGGNIVLKEGVNYGTSLPQAGTKGRVFFRVVG